jgi:hypothetical protein
LLSFGAIPFTEPAGMTREQPPVVGGPVAVYSQAGMATGSTGTRVFGVGMSEQWAAVMVSLAPL